MNFEQLKQHDPAEWRAVHASLRGVGISSARAFAKHLSGNEIDDIASDAIEVACAKIGEIKPIEAALKAFVSRTAFLKAHAAVRDKDRKVVGHSVSLEQHLEETGDDSELVSEEIPPDVLLNKSEATQLFWELVQTLGKADADLLWSLVVEKIPQEQVAETHGWSTNSVGNRKNQACARLAKRLRSDPRATQLLKQLELDHYIE